MKTNFQIEGFHGVFDDSDRTMRFRSSDHTADQDDLSNGEYGERADAEIVFHIPDTDTDIAEARFFATFYTESDCHLAVASDLQHIVDVVLRADDAHNFSIAQYLSDELLHHVGSGIVRDLPTLLAWQKTVFCEPLDSEQQLVWLLSPDEQSPSVLESAGYQRIALSMSNHDRASVQTQSLGTVDRMLHR